MPASYTVAVVLGLGGLIWYLNKKQKEQGLSGLGYSGRTLHPNHPMHPYRNGVPAVWGGRRIHY